MPYFYLYDSYLQDRSYSNQLIRLETTITDLGLQGKVGRLTLLKSIRDLIENALRDNTDTIVVVGNDITFSQTAEILALHPKITLGFIPLGPTNQTLAYLLGIPLGILACHTLSSRIVEKINLPKINNQSFIKSAEAQGVATFNCENHYQLSVSYPHYYKICNLDVWGESDQAISNPKDGLVEVVLTPHKPKSWWNKFKKTPASSPTVLPLKNVRLDAVGDSLSLLIDGHRVIKTPATVVATGDYLRVIVGRDRKFK
ncbi:MAG: diacylglycerol kinase family protein [Patescibacteria group bacterium]